ncbi:MAG TPA: hypothetical protein VG722_00625 [Tepidisphaeraceae bacterium]|nr:hypothetical protein [Tepidisphaeraceae bacterium]
MSETNARKRFIRANYNDVAGPLDRRFQFCVGSDRAAIHLRGDDIRDLKFVCDTCGFKYIRFHGLLDDEMGVYRQSPTGAPIYDWTKINQIYDAFLAMGLKPFVELGFMPGALASGTKTIFWFKSNVTPPKSYEKWASLVSALVQHLTDRYGVDEVKTWFFEVWNEPNLANFWSGTQAEYLHLYEVSAHAIKAINRNYRVGGPATAGGQWITPFIRYCHDNHVPLDFISAHHYGVTEGFLDIDGKKKLILDWSPDAVVSGVRQVRDEIRQSPMPDLPFHLTEWSSSYHSRDPVHDSYFSAAYILEKLKQSGHAADSMSYWTFSDNFEEIGPPPSPFHGGFGLLNIQGLRKPAYFSYAFLNRLGDTQLHCNDSRSWVCKSNSGIQILFWDFSVLEQKSPDQVFFAQDLPAKPIGEAHIQISDLPQGHYMLSVTRVGYRNNDVYTAFLDLHSPYDPIHHAFVPEADLVKLRSASSGKSITEKEILIQNGNPFELTLDLNQNDVCFVTLQNINISK